MDGLSEVLHRVRLNGTLLYHYELGRPWSLALPRIPEAVFHYVSQGAAVLSREDGRTLELAAGDLVLICDGQPHRLWSDANTPPFPLLQLERLPAHLGVVRLGGEQDPVSTMICGYFSLSRPWRTSVLELLPPVLRLRPDHDWLETILQRLVTESAVQRPGHCAMLSRMTDVLFMEVLRTWIKSLAPGEGGWLGAIGDPHIGKALRLIHEDPGRPWSLHELSKQAGLGRSAFAARFTRLVGQPAHRYLIARRMDEAALLLDSTDDTIARIAARVGYATTTAFSKAFQQHHRLSPGRYRMTTKDPDSGWARPPARLAVG